MVKSKVLSELSGSELDSPVVSKRVYNIVTYTPNKYPDVECIIVFGSAVTNRCTSYSDLDLCIVGDPNLKFEVPTDDFEECDVVWAHQLRPDSELLSRIKETGVAYGPFQS